jgi:enoyl-CoA hydratase/carnithine racemase
VTTVRSARAGHVATITLDRPARHNAIDDETYDQFVQAWNEVSADDSARVVVLRGEGRSFCSGRDTAVLGERAGGESDLSFIRRHQQTRVAQLSCPKPVLAALKGYVLGGGLELALAADIRVAAPDVQLAFPEVSYGLMTDTGGSPLAAMLAGPSRAKLMLMTARRVDAATALSWGLVDEVVDAGDLDARAAELAAEIAAHPPELLAMIKQTVDGMWHGQILAAMRAELLGQAALFGGADYRARRAAWSQGE